MGLYLNLEEGAMGRLQQVVITIEDAFLNADLSENER